MHHRSGRSYNACMSKQLLRISKQHLRNGVDVRLVAGEGLSGLATADVPELSTGIASTGNEGVHVRGK
jgi:hypothetical protein